MVIKTRGFLSVGSSSMLVRRVSLGVLQVLMMALCIVVWGYFRRLM